MHTDPNLLPSAPAAEKTGEPEFLKGVPREDPPWSLLDIVSIVVVAFLAVIFVGIAAIAIATHLPAFRGLSTIDLGRDPRVIIPAQFAAYVVVVVFMYFVVRSRAVGFFEGVRWNWPQRLYAFVSLGVVLAFAVQVAGWFLPMPKSVPFDLYFRDATSAWILAVFGIAVAPLVEELFFRGFLYPVLARRLGLAYGVMLTAFAFALLHQGQLAHAWAPLLLLFCVGVVLTLVRAISGSVAASFLIHVAYNSTLFVVLYLQTDHFRHLERMA